MKKVIDGKKIAEDIKDKVVKEIVKINKGMKASIDIRPNLAIIMVGERADSMLYVNLKEKEAKKVGIDTHIYKCDVDIEEREIFEMIDCLNKDKVIDAILVQLPLPKDFDTDGIIQAIDPQKDVDRFHPDNLVVLFKTCDHAHVMPPLFKVVLKILESIDFDLENKTVCIISNSDIFQKSLAKVLECRKAKVCTAYAQDKDLKKKVKQADVLISAVGKPGYIKKDIIKKDAVIIDIGINKVKGKLRGDVDFEDCVEKCGYITPTPGGVGPLTVAALFENTVELYKKRHK